MFLMPENKWVRLLAYITGLVNQKLLLQNEYLAAENRILRRTCPPGCACRIRSDTRWPIGKRLGRKALEKVACVAKPNTILAWYRGLIAHKFDGSQCRIHPGRPRISADVEELVVRFPARTQVGVTTASWGRWPTWVIRFRTRLWAISYAATTSRPLPGGVKRQLGRNSSAGIWTCSLEPISSRSRC